MIRQGQGREVTIGSPKETTHASEDQSGGGLGRKGTEHGGSEMETGTMSEASRSCSVKPWRRLI